MRPTYHCKQCGSRFEKRRSGGSKNTYCSRECAFADIKAWQKRSASVALRTAKTKFPATLVWFRSCVVCRTPFVARRLKQTKCSAECVRHGQYVKDRSPRKCKGCATQFVPEYGTWRRDYCSKECARKTERRISKAQRRARIKAGQVDKIDPLKICERDHWSCQHCGVDTPRELRGTLAPNAPEIDHIIPLSRCGAHTQENVCCSCRACNLTKGSEVWIPKGYVVGSMRIHPGGRVGTAVGPLKVQAL